MNQPGQAAAAGTERMKPTMQKKITGTQIQGMSSFVSFWWLSPNCAFAVGRASSYTPRP